MRYSILAALVVLLNCGSVMCYGGDVMGSREKAVQKMFGAPVVGQPNNIKVGGFIATTKTHGPISQLLKK